MNMTIQGIVRIGGFSFDWISFPDLTGLSQIEIFRGRFNCIDNRFGVYYFCDESESVPYVGLCGTKTIQTQYMKKRIRQYFKPYRLDTGNIFGKKWIERNHPSSQDVHQSYRENFRPYIEHLRLRTLSTVGTHLTDEQKITLPGVIKDMENVLIYKYKPTYNEHRYRLTADEQDSLTLLNVLPNSSPPENPPGG